MKFRKKKKSMYLRSFYGFLRLEIPNIIQIVTLLGFLIYLTKTYFLKIVLDFLIVTLLALYLTEKLKIFVNNELFRSYLNYKDIDVKILIKKYNKYLSVFSFCLGMLVWLLISSFS
ncbi:MAG: hypothetical protein KIH89_004260 [Candidatus Shapirobacteria bacterium]|nr:hypothetical protein [Candidatus Shapirobacteria bacterium]